MNHRQIWSIVVLSLTLVSGAFAQTASPSASTISDEELKRYAMAMDSIDELTKNTMKMITELVEKNDKLSGARYNELSRIINDEAKLAEAKATPEEIAGVKEVIAKRDEETVRINSIYTSLAKEYVGAAIFNKVRAALKTDSAVKARYDEMMKELTKDNG